MPRVDLTPAEWRAAHRRAVIRGYELTKSLAKAQELASAAIAAALEPDRAPWDPKKHRTFADYLCDIVWSLHGNETQSYRVTKASARLTEAEGASVPASQRPEDLTLGARDDELAQRRYAALRRRVEDDPLILLLLEADPEDREDAPAPDPPRQGEMTVEEAEAPAAHMPATRVAEPASTRRALAKGYTHKEIKNARERLKRHAIVVAAENPEP